mmetsp:Transcript_60121/g.159761  ORF Transcript_60121/g.159761 Transcript_60121/m.159761 type:complete len:865 (-) Transcript_60121:1811-4405(-)
MNATPASSCTVESIEVCAETHNFDATSPILFPFLTLLLGAVANKGLKILHRISGIRFPYSIALYTLGIISGFLFYRSLHCNSPAGDDCLRPRNFWTLVQFQETLFLWMRIPGRVILFVFLPPLIYEGSAYTNVHKFCQHFVGGLLLAGPGVALQTLLIGATLQYFFPYGWNWAECLLVGAILSSTDPVAVISLLRELGSVPDLRVLIEAESILNDGTAIVAYELCYLALTTKSSTSEADLVSFPVEASWLCLGGPAIGGIIGWAALMLLVRMGSPLLEATITIAAAYICFFVAQGPAGASGVLAVLTLGLLIATYGPSVTSREASHFLHVFWSVVEYMANTIIFVLGGATVAFDVFLLRGDLVNIKEWGLLFMLYLALLLSRIVMVVLFVPFLRAFGYKLKHEDCKLKEFARYMVVLSWSGLRGVVGMALGLIVYRDQVLRQHVSDPLYPQRVLFFVTGVVTLTLIANGLTTEHLILALGLSRPSERSKLDKMLLKQAGSELGRHYYDEVKRRQESPEHAALQHVDWQAVRLLTAGDQQITASHGHGNSSQHSASQYWFSWCACGLGRLSWWRQDIDVALNAVATAAAGSITMDDSDEDVEVAKVEGMQSSLLNPVIDVAASPAPETEPLLLNNHEHPGVSPQLKRSSSKRKARSKPRLPPARIYDMCVAAARASYADQVAEGLISPRVYRMLHTASNLAEDFLTTKQAREAAANRPSTESGLDSTINPTELPASGCNSPAPGAPPSPQLFPDLSSHSMQMGVSTERMRLARSPEQSNYPVLHWKLFDIGWMGWLETDAHAESNVKHRIPAFLRISRAANRAEDQIEGAAAVVQVSGLRSPSIVSNQCVNFPMESKWMLVSTLF